MTQTTNFYIGFPNLAIMLLRLLAYCRGYLNTAEVDILPLRNILG